MISVARVAWLRALPPTETRASGRSLARLRQRETCNLRFDVTFDGELRTAMNKVWAEQFARPRMSVEEPHLSPNIEALDVSVVADGGVLTRENAAIPAPSRPV